MKRSLVLAADLGGTRLRMALGDGTGPWLRVSDRPRPDDRDGTGLGVALREALADWAGHGPVAAIGLSVAAVVDNEGGVERAENLGWTDLPIGPQIAEATDLPVRVDTDVFCGALAEARIGAAQGVKSALYLALGTGIGHAVILDGRVHVGAGRAANAFGHLVRDPEGPPCYCGGRGCLCLLAGGAAQAASCPPAGALDALAWAIGQAVTLLGPDRVVLSGGALRQSWFDLDALRARVPALHYPGSPTPDIRLAALEDPNLRGAAFLTQTEFS